MLPDLSTVFLAACGRGRDAWRQRPELAGWLAELVHTARATWPQLAVPLDAYVGRLARSCDQPVASRELLAAIHATDLYLATACERGAPGALEALVDAHFPHLDAALRSIDAPATLIEHLRANLLEILFVGAGDAGPLIAAFKGRSALRTWLRAIATRTALKLMRTSRRANQRVLGDPARAEVADPATDLELAQLRARHGDEVERALEDALHGLSRRQRTLLRQHFIDGLSIDQLGERYRVHRATAARWLVTSRVVLFDDTRQLLMSRLGLDRSQLDHIVRLVNHELDVSLDRLLRSPVGSETAGDGSVTARSDRRSPPRT